MSYTLKLLSENDVDECIDVILKSTGEQLPAIPESQRRESVRAVIYGDHAISVVAKKEDKIIGVISGTSHIPPNIVFLSAIDEESVKEGLSFALINEFVNVVRKKVPKAPCIKTTVATENTGAVALYSGAGFKIEGFAKEAIQGKDVAFLKKSLDKKSLKSKFFRYLS